MDLTGGIDNRNSVGGGGWGEIKFSFNHPPVFLKLCLHC